VLTWYRAQPPERQGAVMVGVALCVLVVVVAGSLLDVPFWVPLVVAAGGVLLSMLLRRERMRP
jgi:Flp pilus assembly protein TadB